MIELPKFVERSCCRLALIAVLALFHPAAAQAARLDQRGAPCFEIIAPRGGYTQSMSPLLFNRCTGEAWLSTRTRSGPAKRNGSGQQDYRWVPVPVEPARVWDTSTAKRVTASPNQAPTDAADEGGRKCFVFVGRRFCE